MREKVKETTLTIQLPRFAKSHGLVALENLRVKAMSKSAKTDLSITPVGMCARNRALIWSYRMRGGCECDNQYSKGGTRPVSLPSER